MRVRDSLITMAVSATMAAVAGSALAQGATIGPAPTTRVGPAAGPGPSAAPAPTAAPGAATPGRPAAVETRLDELKAALQLKPDQLGAWNAYEAGVKAQAAEQSKLRAEASRMRSSDPKAAADQRAQMSKRRAESADEVEKLGNSLAATLNPEQKATFEKMRPQRGQPRRGGA